VDTENDVPVSFAFVYYEGGGVTWTKGGIINPGRPIPDSAVEVHGITNERAQTEGQDLLAAIVAITDTLVDASRRAVPVVGMNVAFDLKMIDACSRRMRGLPLANTGWAGPVLDILVIDRHYDTYRRGSRKLGDLCVEYGVEAGTLHDPHSDVAATIGVLLAQAQRYPELGAMRIEELYAHQQQWHREWALNYSSWRVSRGQEPLQQTALEWPLIPVAQTKVRL
jgi:DNA polymerase-3 subunit epsilon